MTRIDPYSSLGNHVSTSSQVYFGINGRKGPNDRGLSRKHIIEGTLDSLERLQMNYGMTSDHHEK